MEYIVEELAGIAPERPKCLEVAAEESLQELYGRKLANEGPRVAQDHDRPLRGQRCP